MMKKKRVVLLGATGSIGENTLRVIAAHPGRLELAAVAARANWKKLAEIAHTFGVRRVGLFEDEAYAAAKRSGAFPPGTAFFGGLAGLVELAQLPGADTVLVAVVGTVGLEPALAALAAGKDLALANKEILVLAGKFVMAAARAHGAKLLPVDSEHNALFQCIEGHAADSVRRIILTASGGAFRDWPAERLAHATPGDALRHPNWAMGPKVTVDAATMANKGLELIEAQWLFSSAPRPMRGGAASAKHRALPRGVQRRRYARPALPALDDVSDPARLAASGTRRGSGSAARFHAAGFIGISAGGRGALSPVPAGAAGDGGRRHRAGRIQRGQ